MEALEGVSRIWLVGKMVHDLFEAILALDGFDRYLKENLSQNRKQELGPSGPKEVELSGRFAADLEASEKVIKCLTLTPSLIAHMDAALKSAALKSAASPNKISSKRRSAHGNHKHVPNARPLAPQRVVSSETNHKFPSTAGPTGLNAAEWLVMSFSPSQGVRAVLTFAFKAPILRHSMSCRQRLTLPMNMSSRSLGSIYLLAYLKFNSDFHWWRDL
jgi:hypothetical protein